MKPEMPATEIESLRSQLAEATAAWYDRDNRLIAAEARLADLEAERELIVARAENAEAALVAEVAKNGRHAMRVTIAQLEARLQKVMARCADLLDEDQFNELDAIASSASGERDATSAQLAAAQRFFHSAPAGCNHFPGQVNCEWCTEPERATQPVEPKP